MQTPRSKPLRNLAGSLLLAHPQLKDPNFRRTVVLMSVHDQNGAMGVVLNRPTGKTLGQLNGAFTYSPLASVPVFSGGPVKLEQILLVAWQPHGEGYRLHFGIDPEQATAFAAGEDTILRAFAGYSGWEAGQLENEMRQSTWIVSPLPFEMFRAEPDEGLWRLLLGNIGPEWKLLAYEPEDPSEN